MLLWIWLIWKIWIWLKIYSELWLLLIKFYGHLKKWPNFWSFSQLKLYKSKDCERLSEKPAVFGPKKSLRLQFSRLQAPQPTMYLFKTIIWWNKNRKHAKPLNWNLLLMNWPPSAAIKSEQNLRGFYQRQSLAQSCTPQGLGDLVTASTQGYVRLSQVRLGWAS